MTGAAQPIKLEFTAYPGDKEPAASAAPVSEMRIPLPAYIPVNVYVPLLCVMMNHSAKEPAGTGGVTAPLAAGSITYTLNGVEIDWTPVT